MSFETQELTTVRELAVGAKKETTYGTGLLDASFTHQPRFEAGAFHSLQKQYYSDADKAGKGHNWPTKRQELARMLTMPLAFDLTDFMAGWLGAFFFGADAVSGGGPYTHLFTPLVSTNIFPVTSLYVEDTADLKRKLLDIGISELEIQWGASGPVTARCTCVGSGRFTAGAVALPGAAAHNLILASDADILVGAQGGAVSIKERNRGGTIKFSQELTPHRAPGGGLYSTFHKLGKMRCSVSLAIAAKDTDDVESIFIADTIRELQVNINSGAAAQLNIKLPGMYYSAAQLQADGNEAVWQVDANDADGVIKSGGNNYVEYTAINSQATYLGAG